MNNSNDQEEHPLRTARVEAGLSQAKLAILAEVDSRLISNIENYKAVPYPKIMVQLAVTLDIPVALLFPDDWKPSTKIK